MDLMFSSLWKGCIDAQLAASHGRTNLLQRLLRHGKIGVDGPRLVDDGQDCLIVLNHISGVDQKQADTTLDG
jgi:hypothetical protein